MSRNLCTVFAQVAERQPQHPALVRILKGQTFPITYGEYLQRVIHFSAGLEATGVSFGDRVLLLSENRPEWAIADYALLSLGAIVVPVYPSLPPNQIVYLAQDSGARAIIVSEEKQYRKAVEVSKSVPQLETIVVMDPPDDLASNAISFADVEQRGREVSDAEKRFRERIAQIPPEHIATFIYTSGTTGEPKGAMLSHHNLLSNVEGSLQALHAGPEDVFLSFLPLSHVFERMAGHFTAVACGATVYYCETLFTIARDMQIARPTVMLAVPRLFDSIRERILDNVTKQSRLRQRIFHWAMRNGAKAAQAVRGERHWTPWLRLKWRLADRLVLRKVREVTGGRLRFFVSGGAALGKHNAEFFHAFGILVLEGYGLTETSPVVAVNREHHYRFGTVGLPIPGVEVRIAEDGEILVRGPNVMVGYHNKPAETAEVIDPEGWLHTGDLGSLDADGFLRITGRKKDIIVLANGKNVAPVPIEEQLKTSPYISEAVLFGDEQDVITALIVPNFERVREWAKMQGLLVRSDSELVLLPEVKQLVRQEIDRLTTHLAEFEKVRRFTLLDHPFSIETGELTPTLKVRRHFIKQRYAKELEAMRR
ncbi:MAG: long-chain fatty acid--CoA ligase [bacterium]|nr:long-chain fatty acid--CoA ligase [bacterium]MCS7310611.1 long-chain fatty acid--CoA ligase [Armatimonadota bacterium]MDW8105543.1 long-chain fatty acid--CoA ligase [Armatimonadota bacterium]